MASILVTGGAGFIGANLTARLLKLKHKVAVIDNLSTGFRHNLPLQNKNLAFYEKNINENLKPIFAKHRFDYIFHLAGQIDVRKAVSDPRADAEINILGIINLLQEARTTKIKKFIYASSGGAVYGEPEKMPVPKNAPIRPLSPYGVSKYAAEKYLETFGRLYRLPYAILRYANVYGPGQNSHGEAGVVAIFINHLLKKERPSLFAFGKNKRDYIFVDDVAEANLKAMAGRENAVYNIGTGKTTTTEELFQIISQELKSKIKPRLEPARPGEVEAISLDARLAAAELSWQARVSLPAGIRQTIQWFLENRKSI